MWAAFYTEVNFGYGEKIGLPYMDPIINNKTTSSRKAGRFKANGKSVNEVEYY